MKSKIIMILTAIFFALNAFGGQPIFQPVEGYLSSIKFVRDYDVKIREILLGDIRNFSPCMLLKKTSFFPEEAIYISGEKLVYLRCERQIWRDEDPSSIKVKKIEVSVGKPIADSISELWFIALKHTGYTDEKFTYNENKSYYFSAFKDEVGQRCGLASYSNPKCIASDLIDLIKGLKNFEKTEEQISNTLDKISAIEKRVSALSR